MKCSPKNANARECSKFIQMVIWPTGIHAQRAPVAFQPPG